MSVAMVICILVLFFMYLLYYHLTQYAVLFSAKFYRKLSFISSLRELLARVPIEVAAVPEKVKAYDSLHCE